MSLSALLLITILSFFCEKIPLNGGLGYDGVSYGNLVKEIPRLLDGSLKLGLDSSNRFLPSLLCRTFLSVFDIELSNRNIVIFFEIYNVLLLAATAWLWCSLCINESFSCRTRWVGFIALFFSHATLKYNIYYPVLTDITAMFLGMAMLWSYRKSQTTILLAASFAGGITWPTLLPQGLILWLFPSQSTLNGPPAPKSSFALSAILVTLLVLRFFQRNEVPVPESILPLLGAAIEVIYIGWALYHFFNSKAFFQPKLFIMNLSWLRLVSATAAICLFPLALSQLTNYKLNFFTLGEYYIYSSVRAGMKFPGEFLVAHPLYFGPWVLLLMLLFKGGAEQARKSGLGLLLVCLLLLVQSVTPLSRQLIAGVPFFVFLLAGTVEHCKYLSRRFIAWFAVLSVLYSKVWMRFSTDPDNAEMTFSFDKYVSSTGFWMPFSYYLWQGLIVLLTLVGLYFVLRRMRFGQQSNQSAFVENVFYSGKREN